VPEYARGGRVLTFWVVVPGELLLVAVPPDPLLLRAAAVSAGTSNMPTRINAETVAAGDRIVTLRPCAPGSPLSRG